LAALAYVVVAKKSQITTLLREIETDNKLAIVGENVFA
jgi:hypothetical protein